ncbi:TerD family protein, partial [Xanthomonadaceae bacterium JHOS43]|nr:TerD family protein [Xanthomonadaceae bacterium JHOS43]
MTDKISLKKGSSEKISLKKVAPALKELRLEFSWKSDSKLDLDVSALVCRHNAAGNPEMLSARHLVCYANKFDPERSTFAGDDVRDGTGSMEQIDITLAKISPDAQEIAFVLTIDDDTGLKRFGHV